MLIIPNFHFEPFYFQSVGPPSFETFLRLPLAQMLSHQDSAINKQKSIKLNKSTDCLKTDHVVLANNIKFYIAKCNFFY